MNLVRSLDMVVEQCSNSSVLTDELKQKIHKIKERGARFREGKKLGAAQVADTAGYRGKAAGLKREAAALLVQDWAMVFPDEPPLPVPAPEPLPSAIEAFPPKPDDLLNAGEVQPTPDGNLDGGSQPLPTSPIDMRRQQSRVWWPRQE